MCSAFTYRQRSLTPIRSERTTIGDLVGVTADSVYEAAALGLSRLRRDEWSRSDRAGNAHRDEPSQAS
jgi:hypothetical protein